MSLYLSTDELAWIRADVARMLPDTAIIQSKALISDGAGGWTETWAAVSGGTVAARLDPLKRSPSDTLVAGREAVIVQYQLTMPYDAPLASERRVAINGRTYDVLQVDVDHSWNVSRRAVVMEAR